MSDDAAFDKWFSAEIGLDADRQRGESFRALVSRYIPKIAKAAWDAGREAQRHDHAVLAEHNRQLLALVAADLGLPPFSPSAPVIEDDDELPF